VFDAAGWATERAFGLLQQFPKIPFGGPGLIWNKSRKIGQYNKYECTTDQELVGVAAYSRGRCFVFTH